MIPSYPTNSLIAPYKKKYRTTTGGFQSGNKAAKLVYENGLIHEKNTVSVTM